MFPAKYDTLYILHTSFFQNNITGTKTAELSVPEYGKKFSISLGFQNGSFQGHTETTTHSSMLIIGYTRIIYKKSKSIIILSTPATAG